MSEIKDESRRDLLKKIGIGSAALAGLSFVPEKWTSPLLEFSSLPAHAVTSGPTKIKWYGIKWGGNPNDNSEGRDRTWWTRIHGGDYKPWHRKFPLPGWVDGKSYRMEFVFSNGTKFSVPDTRKMAMNSNGPKYTPQDPGERDPRKSHPSIAAQLGASPKWVKFRIL